MISVEKSLSDAFAAGTDARAADVSIADNPFPVATRRHEEWTAGWKATFDLDEDDDPQSSRLRSQDEITPRN